MKKIMMLLMLSVFFLMGGMSEGVAQKEAKDTAAKAGGEYITANLGSTVRMYFQLSSELNNSSTIALCLGRPGSALEPLAILYKNGNVLYPLNMDHRLSISFDASRNMIIATLTNVRAEDEGRCFLQCT